MVKRCAALPDHRSSPVANAVCAVVVGAGGFGRHYARILSRLNAEAPAGVPKIRRLVLTRTDGAAAEAQARALCDDPLCAVAEVIPARVRDLAGLTALLGVHRPAFTCIAARDSVAGDAVHVPYARAALARGSVLCEKPFCAPGGHDAALAALAEFRQFPFANRFGLELPMAVVGLRMAAHPRVGLILSAGRRFAFRWETQRLTGGDIFSNLAHHPWSLLPRGLNPIRVSVTTGPDRAVIEMEMAEGKNRAPVECRMDLRIGGRCRRMTVDGHRFDFVDQSGAVIVKELCPETTPGPDRPGILSVENPLRKNIVAVLRGEPVTGLDRTIASQRFLAVVYGALSG